MLLAFAMMIVASLFYGSNVGLKAALIYWAAFILGNLVIGGLHIPIIAVPYSMVICFLFYAKGKAS